jgi:hypothetical protein
MSSVSSIKHGDSNIEIREQARLIAIKDFSKTKLYKMDSVFIVSIEDTFRRMVLTKTGDHNYKFVVGKTYPNIIAVDILGEENKFFLDTTVALTSQNVIPPSYIEQNGKLFIWRDKQHTLTDSAIRVLDKYHMFKRGRGDDWAKFEGSIDDAKQNASYYFCRNNLSVYKKKITNVGTGGYDPPKLNCK